MNRNVGIFFLVLLVLIVIFTAAWYSGMFVPKSNFGGKSNVSGTSFTFDYPAYWYQEASDKLTAAPDYTSVAMVYDPKQMTTYCLINEVYAVNRTGGYPNETTKYNILSDRIYNLNGRTAREIIYTYTDPNNILMKSMDTIITITPGKTFILIHCNAKIEDFDFNRPCFNLIVNSFHIKS
jgi:hypothetical protein